MLRFLAAFSVLLFISSATFPLDRFRDCAPLSATPVPGDGNDTSAAIAITLSDSIYPDPLIYQRVRADVAAIFQLQPELRDIVFSGRYDTKSLLVNVLSKSEANELVSGKDAEWSCLLKKLSAVSSEVISDNLIVVKFAQPLNPIVAGKEFAKIKGVTKVEPNVLIGRARSICALRLADAWEYVAIKGSGDCPSGCTHFDYYLLRSTAPGVVALVDTASSDGPKKKWITRLREDPHCR